MLRISDPLMFGKEGKEKKYCINLGNYTTLYA